MYKLLPLALLGTTLIAGTAFADVGQVEKKELMRLTTTELDNVDGGWRRGGISIGFANADADAHVYGGRSRLVATNAETIVVLAPHFAGAASTSQSLAISFH